MQKAETKSDATIILGKKEGVIRPYPVATCCNTMMDFIVQGTKAGTIYLDFQATQKLVAGRKSLTPELEFNKCPWCGTALKYFISTEVIQNGD